MITGKTSLRVSGSNILAGMSVTKINAPVTSGVVVSFSVMLYTSPTTGLWWNVLTNKFDLESEPALQDADQVGTTNTYEYLLSEAYSSDEYYHVHVKSVGEVNYETYFNDSTDEAAKSAVTALRNRGFRRENISREMIFEQIKRVLSITQDSNKQWKRLNNSSKRVQDGR